MVTHFYARVSSRDQDPKPQIEAAIARGISPVNIHTETASGARHGRPVLSNLLAALEFARHVDAGAAKWGPHHQGRQDHS